jgi:hypothetical protein
MVKAAERLKPVERRGTVGKIVTIPTGVGCWAGGLREWDNSGDSIFALLGNESE